MKELERLLSILLVVQRQRSVTAAALAQRCEVSPRTIYRDVQTLSGLGIPLYADRGRKGGIRLLPGYFLPPLMFTREEASALLIGLTLLRNVRAAPFPTAVAAAEQKLLVALPDPLRTLLTQAERLIGVEPPPVDIFHHEQAAPDVPLRNEPITPSESTLVSLWLQGIFEHHMLALTYRSPYATDARADVIAPLGAFWDRDRWYLVGHNQEHATSTRLWRADRIRTLTLLPECQPSRSEDFDIRTLLDHAWLADAMAHWQNDAPVELHLTQKQAALLRRDWYYQHAQFAALPDGNVRLRFGESAPQAVFALLRWLGPGAELITPAAWRAQLRQELHDLWVAHTE